MIYNELDGLVTSGNSVICTQVRTINNCPRMVNNNLLQTDSGTSPFEYNMGSGRT